MPFIVEMHFVFSSIDYRGYILTTVFCSIMVLSTICLTLLAVSPSFYVAFGISVVKIKTKKKNNICFIDARYLINYAKVLGVM